MPRSVAKMETFLIQLTGQLDALELPERACAICGKDAAKRGLYVGLFCHLHPECQQKEGVDFTRINSVNPYEVSAEPPSAEKIAELAASMADYRQDILQRVSRLVGFPSVKGDPTPEAPFGAETAAVLQDFLNIAEDCGFKTVNLDNRAGYVQWGEGEKLIAALCHLDIVPAGTGWSQDAFEAKEENGRLIGRGVLDDKGPAIAVLYAMKALRDEGYEPAGRIRLITGLDEENGSNCMDWYKLTEELPVAGFTADATFPVIYAEKGILWATLSMNAAQSQEDRLRLIRAEGGSAANMVAGQCSLLFDGQEPILVEGRQAHASKPENGINAISMAMEKAADQLAAEDSSHPFVDMYRELIGMTTDGRLLGLDRSDESGPLTLNAGLLELDESHAAVTLDIRYPASFDVDSIKEMIEQRAAEAGAECNWEKHMSPLFIDKESELITSLNKVYQIMTDTNAEPAAIGGGTYARSIDNIVAFGPAFPGDADECHQADESMDIDKLLAAAAIYREALRALSRD